MAAGSLRSDPKRRSNQISYQICFIFPFSSSFDSAKHGRIQGPCWRLGLDLRCAGPLGSRLGQQSGALDVGWRGLRAPLLQGARGDKGLLPLILGRKSVSGAENRCYGVGFPAETDQIKLCIDTVWILYRYSIGTVSIVYRYCFILMVKPSFFGKSGPKTGPWWSD